MRRSCSDGSFAPSSPRTLWLLLGCVLSSGFCVPWARAGSVVVPVDQPTIQAAIDVAVDGDEILVSPGTYPENLLCNKGVTIRSTDGPANTIIDGLFLGPAVTLVGSGARLEGFTVRNAQQLGIIAASGIICNGTVQVVGNIVTQNSGDRGAGIRCLNGSTVLILDNEICDNMASSRGGGIYCDDGSSVTIRGNRIHDNVALVGGGIYLELCDGLVENSWVTDNEALLNGGGISTYLADLTVRGVTVAFNTCGEEGAGLFLSGSAVVSHCIVWGNSGSLLPMAPNGGSLEVEYSDIEGGWAGTGNLAVDPLFVDAPGGDYHLAMASPCIDAGRNDLVNAATTDVDGEPRIDRCTVDLGGDETDLFSDPCSQDTVSDLVWELDGETLSLSWTNSALYDALHVVRDGISVQVLAGDQTTYEVRVADPGVAVYCVLPVTADGVCCGPSIRVGIPGTWYVDGSGAGLGTGTEEDPFLSIQDALNSAEVVDGSTILVAPGLYSEQIDFCGKMVEVRSQAGAAQTVLDGDLVDGSVVHIARGEGAGTILDGLTITNGTGTEFASGLVMGGGIAVRNAAPVIRNNIITANACQGFGSLGGGIGVSYGGGTRIEDNEISLNSSSGVFMSIGAGIGIMSSQGVELIGNHIVENQGLDSLGGGVAAHTNSSGTIRGCVVAANGAQAGGGILCSGSFAIERCTVAFNVALDNGGGVIGGSGVQVANSILWGNAAPNGGQVSGSPLVQYCDVEGTWPGPGNLDADPLFDDPSKLDYHLLAGSPCIDAGDPMAPPDPDGSVADMGAHPFMSLFQRGDVDGSGVLNGVVDGFFLLSFQFIPGSPPPPCLDAADFDDDGVVSGLVDALALLDFQFVPGSPPPAPPTPGECGADPTVDGLDCASYVCP